jgi:hypothetical protein
MTENNGFIGNPESGIDQFLNRQYESTNSAEETEKKDKNEMASFIAEHFKVINVG